MYTLLFCGNEGKIMFVLITYDVETITAAGKRRLRRIAKKCVDYGQRVQNSVFECELDYSQYLVLKNQLISEIDKERDSLRFYVLGNNWIHKVEHYGKHPEFSINDVLIV